MTDFQKGCCFQASENKMFHHNGIVHVICYSKQAKTERFCLLCCETTAGQSSNLDENRRRENNSDFGRASTSPCSPTSVLVMSAQAMPLYELLALDMQEML